MPDELRAVGSEPDYRFSLANERTMLAYLRTALALIAAGVALLQVFDHPLDTAAGAVLVGAGVAVAANSYRRWRRVEEALRRDEPLPFSRVPAAAAVVLVAVAAAVLIGRLWQP
ncbi:DUF202 domain-containing protein [Phytohabitans sp. ZYX-F-186]|uniref:DUF202 domain-containing protein n=1 Tax=Phytohabitans maris TaxID=3071409 RepID=A0ABU0Z9G9_9ACTN|nr:DUF202 domain-containing protein [Phytohabitans sp. ZYX-F-186]MDQ7903693.1 DUF202 domain-containing protein [Phytohabitans sp. ZYX-F-186]